MVSFDKGPPAAVANHFAKLPDIAPEHRELFWYDWGPVFYRGRLDRRSRLLGIASDPGPTERVVGRTLVGDAGQRVQGFLERLGWPGATASTTSSAAPTCRRSSPSAGTPTARWTCGTPARTCRCSRSRTPRTTPRARCSNSGAQQSRSSGPW